MCFCGRLFLLHQHQWILKRKINKPQHASTPSSLLLKALRLSDELTHNIVLPIFLINFFCHHSLTIPDFSLLAFSFDLCKDWKNFHFTFSLRNSTDIGWLVCIVSYECQSVNRVRKCINFFHGDQYFILTFPIHRILSVSLASLTS